MSNLWSCVSKLRPHIFSFVVIFGILFWKPENLSWQILWIEKWGILSAGILTAMVWNLDRGLRAFKPFLIYFAVMGCASVFLNDMHEPELTYHLRDASLYQLIQFSCFLMFMHMRINLDKALFSVSWFILAAILLSYDPRYDAAYFIRNPSMAATTMVLASGIHPISFLAAVFAHSWTAGVVYAVSTLWALRNRVSGTIRRVIGAMGLVVGFCYVHFHGIPDNGRFHVWKMYFENWLDQGWFAILFGSGIGTGKLFLAQSEFQNRNPTLDYVETFFWAHNDWLQSLCETGVVGALLIVFSVVMLWKKAKEEDRKVLLGYGIAMMANMPMHWVLSALVGWNLCRRICFPLLREHVVCEDSELSSS